MTTRLLAHDRLAELPAAFRDAKPFAHAALDGPLTADAFATLGRELPPLSRFARHEGVARRFGQRPHDRFYLELTAAPTETAPGAIRLEELSPAWRRFVEELRGEPYFSTVVRALGARRATLRFMWHVGVAGSEVSPHRDARKKLGTHIFYFNTEEDWSPAWGGATVLLGGRRTRAMNPEFDEFETATDVPFLGNRSLLFRNDRTAWHGMRRIDAPEGAERRLFNVVFDRVDARGARLVDSAEAAAWRLFSRRMPS